MGKYVYFDFVPIVRIPKEDYTSGHIKVSSVEVLTFDNKEHYHFEHNDIAVYMAENNNLIDTEVYDSLKECPTWTNIIVPMIAWKGDVYD